MTKQITLLIGANSGIARSLASQIVKDTTRKLIVVSRDCRYYQSSTFSDTTCILMNHYTEEAIASAADIVATHAKQAPISQVFIFHGILHNESVMPEKRLEDFNTSAFQQVVDANALTPMLWLKNLTPIIATKTPCKVSVFSARVGSISDNRLGGWYSYRASKAALNMLLKSAAIELGRRAKNVKLIAFHPGTTDTKLSKPFQGNVPKGKLFDCSFVAEQLLTVSNQQPFDNDLSFVDWQGINIPF